MAKLTIRNTVKRYGELEVLHGISVDVADGEFIVLVGPSGCGKSTLLRMIAGLESTSDGEIEIGDQLVNDLEPNERNIAMVFQTYALYPHMTVRDNMAFSMKLARRGKAEIAEKVNQTAAILELAPLLDRYPRELSGGQRQRVAMGRAIVRDPAVFLFDEPLSNLDAKLRVQMRTEIKALHQRLGATMVYVTHDQMEAMTMADRIVVMRAGIVEQVGSPLEIYDRPANDFVAGFIGSPSMNFVTGDVVVDDDGVELHTPAGARWPLPERARPWRGQSVKLGFRPDHLSFPADGPVKARVDLIEPTGAETHVQLSVADEHISAAVKDRPDLSVGQSVILAIDLAKALVFDGGDGKLLC